MTRPRRFFRPLLALWVSSAGCSLLLEDYRIDDSKLKNAQCELGQTRCSGAVRSHCSENLDGWVTVETCDSAELCDSRRDQCKACRSGEYRCSGSSLESCNEDGSGWELREDCPSESPCNLNLEACAACQPNAVQCNQGTLQRCSNDRIWSTVSPCGAPELCSVAEGKCRTSVGCTPGSYDCEGAQLRRCNARGTDWESIATCASPGLCQKARSTPSGELARCPSPVCDGNAAHCVGDQLLACAADFTAWTPIKTCSGDSPCNPKTGDCGACSEGETFCDQADLLRCINGRWSLLESCAAIGLCDAASADCSAPECRRSGDGLCESRANDLKVCGADLRWHDAAICDTAGLCNERDARCDTRVCSPDLIRCDHGRLMQCDGEGTAWKVLRVCEPGTECDPQAADCVSGPCPPGSYRCNDVFLEQCGDNGWRRTSRCASSRLCDAAGGVCVAPSCSAGSARCNGNILERCKADLTDWTQLDCGEATCDATSKRCL